MTGIHVNLPDCSCVAVPVAEPFRWTFSAILLNLVAR